MKLKKIASLALAGIMAVSMLAGCSTSSSSSEEQNPIVPTDVVTYANETLNADEKESFSYVGSAELDAMLKDIASNTSNFSKDDISNAYNAYTSTANYVMMGKLNDKLKGLVNSTFTEAPENGVSKHYGYVYTISGKMNEEEAVKKIAEVFSDWVNTETNCATTVAYNGNDYKCVYSAEISAVKVSNSTATNESAWVVALVLTQKVTDKVTNTLN